MFRCFSDVKKSSGDPLWKIPRGFAKGKSRITESPKAEPGLAQVCCEEDGIHLPFVVHGNHRKEILRHPRHATWWLVLLGVQKPMPAHSIKTRPSMPALLLHTLLRQRDGLRIPLTRGVHDERGAHDGFLCLAGA